MNHFCHLCGKLVDLIGLQPEGVKLCDCKTMASRDNRRLSDKGYLDPLTEIRLLKEEIAALREAVRWCYEGGKLSKEADEAIERARGRA